MPTIVGLHRYLNATVFEPVNRVEPMAWQCYNKLFSACANAKIMSSTVRMHVWVEGRVQGVFYRQSAKAEADRLGLTGWVKNLDDGRVEAVVEGMQFLVQQWVEWSRKGPPHARVQQVHVQTELPLGEIGFAVLPT